MTHTDYPTSPAPTHTTISPWLLVVMTLTLVSFSALSFAKGQLVAKIDRTQVTLEETLKLTLRYNQQVMFGEPDFSQLKQNFDILGNHRSNQYRSVNGRAESWTQWSLTLAPKKEGKLLIPAFKYDGAVSEALEIQVKQAPVYSGSATDKPVFIETEISKDQAFVQEQLLYTIRLFTSVDLAGLNRNDFAVENALLKQVSENQYQRNMGGVPYGVIEITYAIFPQQSGTLTIPAHTWDVTTQSRQGYRYDPFLSRGGQRLRLRIDSRSIDVLPKPGNYSGDHWLPASSITIRQSWSQDPTTFKVGEPITRTLSVQAKGLMASQLPPLKINTLDDIKYYPDQPQSEEALDQDGITTIKRESYAIVPNRAGSFTLPSVTLTWWDTEANRMREATLPVETIEVAGDPTLAAAPTTHDPVTAKEESTQPLITAENAVSVLWLSISGVLALTTLFFAILWLRARAALQLAPTTDMVSKTSSAAESNERQAHKQLREALKSGEANTIRQALLSWGRSFVRQHQLSRDPIGSLEELTALCPTLKQSVDTLEAQLYSQNGTRFDPSALANSVETLRKQPPQNEDINGDSLPPLYHAR